MTSTIVSHNTFIKCAPSFCYITPTSYLDFATASKTHLVLAHLVDLDPVYADFYLTRSQSDFVMMDCSAYEMKEPYAPDKLVELGKRCGAAAVVLPDYPFKPSSVTIEAAEQFIPLFKQAGLMTFFVPQSKTGQLEDWISGYKWAASNPDIDIIGMSILGIPNALTNIDPTFSRVVMTQLLLDRGIFAHHKHHHYLGLNSGPNLEIPSLIRMGVINTIDSSNPVWMGILGHQYTENSDSFLSVKKINLPVDFSISRTKDQATLVRIGHNISLTEQVIKTSNKLPQVWYAEE